MQSLLIVTKSAPWSGSDAREVLDLAFSAAAFELPVSILFVADAVFQLQQQQGAVLEQKDITANLQALALFDIEQLYVSQACLQLRAITEESLTLPVKLLAPQEIAQLFASHQQVINI